LEGERLHIDINSIRKDNSLFPVKLAVYDLDGMEGVHIPGAISRDVAKQSADNSLQDIEMNSIDPSFKVQATTAGINAAKSLLTKKAKLVKVTVKAGYKILLKEEMNQ
jgi:conjugative transposon TraM protein